MIEFDIADFMGRLVIWGPFLMSFAEFSRRFVMDWKAP